MGIIIFKLKTHSRFFKVRKSVCYVWGKKHFLFHSFLILHHWRKKRTQFGSFSPIYVHIFAKFQQTSWPFFKLRCKFVWHFFLKFYFLTWQTLIQVTNTFCCFWIQKVSNASNLQCKIVYILKAGISSCLGNNIESLSPFVRNKCTVMFSNKRSQAKVFTVYLSLVARQNYL